MMNKYQELYDSKKSTVDEILSVIKTGDCIGIAAAAMEPRTISAELHKLHGKVKDINIITAANFLTYPYLEDEKMKETFTVDSFFFQAPHRNAFKLGIANHVPSHLHDCIRRRMDYKKPNVYIGSATPMDKHGYVYLSLSLYMDKDILENADIVILEINPNLPRLGGDTEVHISEIDHILEVNTPILTNPPSQLSETEKIIGKHVASLIDDGDTIQIGIGGIPDAVAAELVGKKDLGIHTELLTPSMGTLIEAGVITNKKKTLNPGKIVATFAFGDQKLYDMLDNNPTVMMKRGSYTNCLETIQAHDNMVSINTAIQVDLTGQVCSESIGTRHFSGTGGQNDFANGATHAKNGRSIIAIRSTAKKGTVSTITPMLEQGAVVTLSRNTIDYIVTEYGIAALRGRSIKERVQNLIAVAHPDFRAELEAAAQELYL